MQPNFELKSYGWQELAILYAPGLTPHSATKRLTKWVTINQDLYNRLKRVGWKAGSRLLTPIQVRVIVDILGEP